MFRILEAQAPAKQNATDTINTLSGRLQSATLLEDRRAAILGLRSFAKLYPASVASGALRNLISSLSNDGEDIETTKLVLETLLMLFSPDETSSEASDDIALWLADEFTQRQVNITVLLDLLDRQDFFSRLYSLQLISAISSARPERTQECVYTAPLGVSRLVAVLDDRREAVRAEGLLLLTALTPSSGDLQKLVAFENAFDRIFAIIKAEGSLSQGGIVVQDCLSLLANLLRLNASNQSFFRETGGVGQIAQLLTEATISTDPHTNSEWISFQREKNVWGLLSVIRLFTLAGSAGTQANQMSFWQNGVVLRVLDLAFLESTTSTIKSEALCTCSDLIRGNGSLQEQFAQREVSISHVDALSKGANGHLPLHVLKVNVIQGLLDLALAVSSPQALEVRLAATECIKAYLHAHGPIRLHFLRRARDGHLGATEEADNILTILLDDSVDGRVADPYRPWVASVILFHLIFEDYDAKTLAMEVVEGDASKGEEEITCIQALSGNLVAREERGDDDRISIGYLMALCAWLFEDPEAVNDFLGEGSNVQSLIQLVLQPRPHKILIAGLCSFLLGIVYEFSSKDSPIPRRELHEILIARLGREQFIDKMTKLREHPLIRDFEVLRQGTVSDEDGHASEVYFDKTFVDFLKDNFSRVLRALDRDPGIEISVLANGKQMGISRELVDSLKSQLEDRNTASAKAESEALTLGRKLDQEQAEHRKTKESSAIELARIRTVNEHLQRHHDEEIQARETEHRRTTSELQRQHQHTFATVHTEHQTSLSSLDATAGHDRQRHAAERADLEGRLAALDGQLERARREHAQDLQTAHDEYAQQIQALEARLQRAVEEAEAAEARVGRAETARAEAEAARTAVQTELDDLFIVLQDVDGKRASGKVRLRELGEQVSDSDDGEGE